MRTAFTTVSTAIATTHGATNEQVLKDVRFVAWLTDTLDDKLAAKTEQSGTYEREWLVHVSISKL